MSTELSWDERLAALRRRAAELRAGSGHVRPLRAADGQSALARLRAAARPLLDAVVECYRALCPAGYPLVEDNEIEGVGGSIGLRFSRWHAFFYALEHAPRRRVAAPPSRLAGTPGLAAVRQKRLPGQPLPPPDPNVELLLVVESLRWDESRGWVEVRRPLPAAWDEAVLVEHLAAYLTELNYDLAAAPSGIMQAGE